MKSHKQSLRVPLNELLTAWVPQVPRLWAAGTAQPRNIPPHHRSTNPRRPLTCIALALLCLIAHAQTTSSLIQRIDAANHNRYDHVLGFTDVEHYEVFRGQDQTHPAATMTVKVTYRKGAGKSYQVLSRSGSGIIQKFGLQPLLDNEKAINDPAKVQNSWFTSDNYEMRPSSETRHMEDSRTCTAIEIHPRHKAPNLIDGTLWVSASDGEICEVNGIASQKPSIFAGTTHMTRYYRMVDGYAMATHARAESDSKLFGKTVVTIQYTEYHLQAR